VEWCGDLVLALVHIAPGVYVVSSAAGLARLTIAWAIFLDLEFTKGEPMTLADYHRKRHFKVTPEPSGEDGRTEKKSGPLLFVVQKHRATHLHYDFRLEWRGTLLSWAVPKGPSLDPAVKRLAMQVEDHPIEYADFEGVIPPGEYGAGTVMVWDTGTWEPEVPDVDEALKKGDLKFTLHGKKLKGSWALVRTRGFGSKPGKTAWLLIKHRDKYASSSDIMLSEPYSAKTYRLLADIARDGGGNVEEAATGDPAAKKKVPAVSAKPPSSRARKRSL
jgi:bifunctional non-homologous end joining protein LigD